MRTIIPGGCQLCAFRGCDGDFCRHGAFKDSDELGYARCAATNSLFEPEVLTALSRHPIMTALLDAPGVWEPSVGQILSRLDHRLTVSYRNSCSAHLVFETVANLAEPYDSDFGLDYSDELAPSAPDCIKKAASALVGSAGFRITKGADCKSPVTAPTELRSILLHRGRKLSTGAVIGISVTLSYVVEVGATK